MFCCPLNFCDWCMWIWICHRFGRKWNRPTPACLSVRLVPQSDECGGRWVTSISNISMTTLHLTRSDTSVHLILTLLEVFNYLYWTSMTHQVHTFVSISWILSADRLMHLALARPWDVLMQKSSALTSVVCNPAYLYASNTSECWLHCF